MSESTELLTSTAKTVEGADLLLNNLEVSRTGVRIKELVLNGTKILGQFKRGDGKVAATHPCSPIFGEETTTHYGLSRHGRLRDSGYLLRETPKGFIASATIKEGSYPEGLKFEQIMRLDTKKLTIIINHRNPSEEEMPVNFGEHFYWNTPNRWEGLKISGRDVTAVVRQNGTIPLNRSNTIEIPGMPPITLEQSGLPWAVLWSCSKNGRLDNDYVCIEPVEGNPATDFFGSKESMIPPGSSRTATITIRI